MFFVVEIVLLIKKKHEYYLEILVFKYKLYKNGQSISKSYLNFLARCKMQDVDVDVVLYLIHQSFEIDKYIMENVFINL